MKSWLCYSNPELGIKGRAFSLSLTCDLAPRSSACANAKAIENQRCAVRSGDRELSSTWRRIGCDGDEQRQVVWRTSGLNRGGNAGSLEHRADDVDQAGARQSHRERRARRCRTLRRGRHRWQVRDFANALVDGVGDVKIAERVDNNRRRIDVGKEWRPQITAETGDSSSRHSADVSIRRYDSDPIIYR